MTAQQTGGEATLVVRPEVTFDELGAALARAGWARGRDRLAAPPLVPGEPEFASWSRGAGAGEGAERISYSFNPVAGFRVLVFRGARAAESRAETALSLPALAPADLRPLLQSRDLRTLLLGILAAGELRAAETLDLLERLRRHPHGAIAGAAVEAHASVVEGMLEEGAARLREEKQRHPEHSALFPHVGDAEVRRQTLRWLMRDYQEANQHILEVLRSALVDADWEVRATAMLAAARLGAREVVEEVRGVELPRAGAGGEGPGDEEREILRAAREAVLSILGGGDDDDDGDELRRHVRRCVEGRAVERPDRVYYFIHSLTEPDETGE